MSNYTLITIDFKIFSANLHMQMPDCWFTYLCIGFVIITIGFIFISIAIFIFDKTKLAKNIYTKLFKRQISSLS